MFVPDADAVLFVVGEDLAFIVYCDNVLEAESAEVGYFVAVEECFGFAVGCGCNPDDSCSDNEQGSNEEEFVLFEFFHILALITPLRPEIIVDYHIHAGISSLWERFVGGIIRMRLL